MEVTREEVAWTLRPVLAKGPRSRRQLLDRAVSGGARPAVIELLHARLPDRQYRQLSDLWPYLADVPVSRYPPEYAPEA